MTWTYTQRGGRISQEDDDSIGFGYSGRGSAKNNPMAQDLPNHGPIPVGRYTIGPPEDTVTHGPFVLPLTPDEANEMYGRAGFLIHGDSLVAPGMASEGCIVAGRDIREKIFLSGDKRLQVVSGEIDNSQWTT